MAHAGRRPTKYIDVFAEQGYKLCLLGATDKEIADFFEVEESTINKWKLDFPQFSESLKRGKTVADTDVADRLYQRAMGFEHDSEEIKVIGAEVVRVPIRKIYAPDTTAAIFWLKNRQKATWRDKTEQENSGEQKLIIETRNASTDSSDADDDD